MTEPRAWLDENHVVCFRPNVTPEEARELGDMLGEAFNAGVVHGYTQAKLEEGSDPLAFEFTSTPT